MQLRPDYGLPVSQVQSEWGPDQNLAQTRGFILDLAPKVTTGSACSEQARAYPHAGNT